MRHINKKQERVVAKERYLLGYYFNILLFIYPAVQKWRSLINRGGKMFPIECFFLALQNWMALHIDTFKGLCPLKIVLCL